MFGSGGFFEAVDAFAELAFAEVAFEALGFDAVAFVELAFDLGLADFEDFEEPLLAEPVFR